MKTINLKDEQVELLLDLINETIERIYIQFENLQTEDAEDKLSTYSDEIIEFYYDVEAQLNKEDDEIGCIRSQIATISSFLDNAKKEGDVIGVNHYEHLLNELNGKYYAKINA